MKRANKAFTLAEVLITLAILGIVAALTIPTIIANKDKAAWTAQLQKTYATLENARRLTAIDEGGDISRLFSSTEVTWGNDALQAFAKHLNLSKNCANGAGCWYDGAKNLDNSLFDGNGKIDSFFVTEGKAILVDGTSILVYSTHTSCSSDNRTSYSPTAYAHWCGWIFVDVNGKKPPNINGRDFFIFDLTRDGIYPSGMDQSNAQINSNCSSISASGDGWYCPAKVIKEGAENY